MIIQYQANKRAHCVVNANDIIFDDAMRQQLKDAAGEVDILLCGYTGAGPFPQTYFELDDPNIKEEADKKKKSFFERYQTLTHFMNAKINIPFAGKYVLGGQLTALNHVRGVADAVEVLDFDDKAIVLSDDGGEINTNDLTARGVRNKKYPLGDMEARFSEISTKKMDYERLFSAEEIEQLPLKRLLVAAARNACSRSECEGDYFFCISLPTKDYAVINTNRDIQNPISFCTEKRALPTPRSEIYIDPRYLFGLLTHIYHWNNAEVGSQYTTRRFPNVFNRKVQGFLNYLAI